MERNGISTSSTISFDGMKRKKKSQRWQRQRQHRARNEIKLPFCDVWYSFRAVCKHTNEDIGNTQNEIEESKKTPSIGIDNIDISTSFSITMQQRNIHLMRCATIRSFFSALRHSFHHSILSIQVETRGSESERERERRCQCSFWLHSQFSFVFVLTSFHRSFDAVDFSFDDGTTMTFGMFIFRISNKLNW